MSKNLLFFCFSTILMYLYFIYLLFTMKLTSEQQKIIDLINQLPADVKNNT